MAGVSFSLNSDGGVVTQQSSMSGGSSTSFSGGPGGGSQSSGGVAGGGNAIEFGDQTAKRALGNLDAMNKLTGGFLQSYIDKAKKEQYAEGLSQAAQGKALIDIEHDQPWYTKLYGPDATVQGAQAFNMQASMQDAQSQFMQAMPQLREKTPDQVRAYIVDKMGSVQSTGDPSFDAMVQAGLAEQLPQMLTAHLSQYMQYTQEQNYNGFTNMGASGGQALQDTLKASNNLTDDDVAQANARYTNTLIKPGNMDQNAYDRGLRDTVLSNAQNGNWQAVRAVKSMPEYQNMPTQMRDNLETQIPKLEEQWALKNPAARNLFTSRADLQYSLQSGQTNLDSSPQGHEMLDKIIDSQEDSNRKLNGDATQVYDNSARAKLHKLLDQGNQRKQAAIQAAAKQQLNYDQSVALATNAINNSNTAGLSGIPLAGGASQQAADAAFTKYLNSPQDAEVQANIMDKLSAVAQHSEYQSPQLKQVLTQQLPGLISGNGPATPQMQTALQYVSALYKGAGGAGAVSAYVGDGAPKVLALLNSGIDINDPEQLKQERELIARASGASASPADVKAAQEAVKTADPGWFKKVMPWAGSGALTQYDINDGNKEQLAYHVAPIIAQYKTAYHMTDEQAANAAFGQVMRNADFVPGAFILHNAALGQQSFESAVNQSHPGMGAQGTSNYQEAVKYVINGELTKAGADASKWQVQAGENLGNGYMTLFMTGPNGAMKHINITADAVGKRCLETYGNKPGTEAGSSWLSEGLPLGGPM